MKLERKTLRFQLKEGGQDGSFSAVFATMNVIDYDGDVTKPGAFEKGAEVVIGSWGHKSYELPVGKGVIGVTDKEASVEGQFFLDTGPGKDTYQTVKNLGDLGEWSYIYEATKYSFGEFEGQRVRFLEGIKVYSVDPVLAGAGIDTRTTSIKGLTRDLTFGAHTAEIAELVTDFIARVKERAEARAKEGRAFSEANTESLAAIAGALKAAGADLEALLAEPGQKGNDDVAREFARYQRIKAGLPAA